MLLIIVLNGILGAICGLWCRVQILIFLLAAAFVEVGIFARNADWSSAFLLAVALVCTVQVAYLSGAFLGAYWLAVSQRKAQRDLADCPHGRLSHH